MLTEEEAKTRWCPFAKKGDFNAGSYGGSASSRDCMGAHFNEHGSFRFGNCIGSACMAWRNRPEQGQRQYQLTYQGKLETYFWDPTGHPGYEGVIVTPLPVIAQGFCGLAGKP